MPSYLRPRRGKKATAISQNVVLKRGEIFFEVPDSGVGTGTGKIKMGDGISSYNDLPYFMQNDLVDASTSAITFTASTNTNNDLLINEIASGSKLQVIVGAIKKLLNNLVTDVTKLNNSLVNIEIKSEGGSVYWRERGADSWSPFSGGSANFATLLWENSDESITFAAQTLVFENVENYKYLIVEYNHSTTSDIKYVTIIDREDNSKGICGIYQSQAWYMRGIEAVTGGLWIGNSNITTSGTANNALIIPTAVYGVDNYFNISLNENESGYEMLLGGDNDASFSLDYRPAASGYGKVGMTKVDGGYSASFTSNSQQCGIYFTDPFDFSKYTEIVVTGTNNSTPFKLVYDCSNRKDIVSYLGVGFWRAGTVTVELSVKATPTSSAWRDEVLASLTHDYSSGLMTITGIYAKKELSNEINDEIFCASFYTKMIGVVDGETNLTNRIGSNEDFMVAEGFGVRVLEPGKYRIHWAGGVSFTADTTTVGLALYVNDVKIHETDDLHVSAIVFDDYEFELKKGDLVNVKLKTNSTAWTEGQASITRVIDHSETLRANNKAAAKCLATGTGTSFSKTVVCDYDGYAYATVTADTATSGALKITLSNNTAGTGGVQKSATSIKGYVVYSEVLEVKKGDTLTVTGEAAYSSIFDLYVIHSGDEVLINDYLRFNGIIGTIQAKNEEGKWIDLYDTNMLPISANIPLVPVLTSDTSDIITTFTNTPYKLFDGDISTLTSDYTLNQDGSKEDHEGYIGYNFNAKTIVKYAEIITQANTTSGYANLAPYVKLQYSDDGTNWKDASTSIALTNNVDVPVIMQSKELKPHQYWRVHYDGCNTQMTYSGAYYYWLRANSVQFYGSKNINNISNEGKVLDRVYYYKKGEFADGIEMSGESTYRKYILHSDHIEVTYCPNANGVIQFAGIDVTEINYIYIDRLNNGGAYSDGFIIYNGAGEILASSQYFTGNIIDVSAYSGIIKVGIHTCTGHLIYNIFGTKEIESPECLAVEVVDNDPGAKDLLWTNPSFTTAFAAQTVEVDLSNYDAVLIQCNYTTAAGTGAPPDASTFSFINKGDTARVMGIYNASDTSSGLTSRLATVSDNGVTFSDPIAVAGGTGNAGSCVPCYIWGVNFGGYKNTQYLRYNQESNQVQVYNTTLEQFVSIATLPSVPIGNVYLYNHGDQCNDITGGWTADTNSGFSTADDMLFGSTYHVNVGDTAITVGNPKTGKAIDLTNYNELHIKGYVQQHGGASANWIRIVIAATLTGSAAKYIDLNAKTESEVVMDITEITGSYYVKMAGFLYGYGDSATFHVSEMWLT